MKKHQKYGTRQKPSSISVLQQSLFNKLDSLGHNRLHQETDPFFSQFQENSRVVNERPNFQLLSKAKQLTYSNKGKIQKMRRQIKKMEEGESADFVTGVGLFQAQTPAQDPIPDGDLMLKDVAYGKLDDLEQLRRMIKKTEDNLRMYSHSVYSTQKEVVSAADRCGRDIDVGLAIKINRCNLDLAFPKQSIVVEPMRRRTASSQRPRKRRE